MLKLNRAHGVVWVNAYAVQSVEPNANGGGCYVALADGRGFHVTDDAASVSRQVALITDRVISSL